MASKSPSTSLDEHVPTAVNPDTGEIVDAEELYEGWETWEALIKRVQRKVLLWIPKTSDTVELRDAYAIDYDMPRTVYGRLVDITEIDGQYGRYRLLIIEPPDGSPLGRQYDGALWAVHSFHTILANEVQRRLDRGHLQLEDEVAIDYGGLARRAKPGQNAPHLYRIEVRHPNTVDVALLIPTTPELPAAEAAALPQS